MSLGLPETAWARDTWTHPFPGVSRLHRVTASPNQTIHVAKVDLCAAGVSIRATRPDQKGKKTSEFGASVFAQVAVNGDFFKAGFGLERGIAVGAGVPWRVDTPEDESVGQIAFGASRAEIIPDRLLQSGSPWMKDVVGGRPSLIDSGGFVDTSGHPTLCQRNPRTAVGLSQDRRTLLLVVVDGRHSQRVGMTCSELATLMKDLGAYDALNLDGGGSSTMWLSTKGVVNHPTDGGGERAVGNHLAVYATGEGPPTSCPETTIPDAEGALAEGQSALGTAGGGDFGRSDDAEASGCNVARSPRTPNAVGGLFAAAVLAFTGLLRRRGSRS